MNMTLENCSEWQELIFETAISVIHVRSTAGPISPNDEEDVPDR